MRILSLIVALACACAGCSAAPSSAPPPAGPAPASLAQIQALVGTAACTDSSQCKTLPIGARACGGPDSYLAYSTAVSPGAPLQVLAERYAQQRRAAIAKSGELSTCQFQPDPGAMCGAGACRLRGAGADPS